MVPEDEALHDGALGEDTEKETTSEAEPKVSAPSPSTESDVPPETSGGEEKATGEDVAPNRLYRFAKKLMDRKELAEDTKDLMVAVLSTSDRAKTEMVRMTAREVRNYLDELRLKEELVKLVRSHSLEVKASISLKPIEGMLSDEDTEDEGE